MREDKPEKLKWGIDFIYNGIFWLINFIPYRGQNKISELSLSNEIISP